MRIAVCDDEELFRIEFKSVLDKVLINAEYDIDTFSGGSSLYEAFLKNPFDLVFLDIEMPGIDGITLAKRLRAVSENVQIVFLTSHIIQDLEKLVDEVIVMDYGSILVQEEAKSLMGRYPGLTLEDIFIELTGKY